MIKDDAYWEQEYIKCKESPIYWYNNYCLVDGKKPEPITQEQYDFILSAAYVRGRAGRIITFPVNNFPKELEAKFKKFHRPL
jgi:hypothetical protein